jgi:DNA-binding SARP family transcriptional activator/CheY-like chemotaxis protein
MVAVQFAILGPVEVTAGGQRLGIGGPRARAVLARLNVAANRVVAAEMLAGELWPDLEPDRAAANLRVRVAKLRRVFRQAGTTDRLVTHAPGYLLIAAPEEVDAVRFDRLAAQGRALLAAGDSAGAAGNLGRALGLWRGPALADVGDWDWARAEAARLSEARLAAVECHLEARLGCGEARELVGELEALTAGHRLRERLWALRMVALYRCGRQAEALDAYQQLRAVLVEQLGIDPGAELRELHQQILAQDPGLAVAGPGWAAPVLSGPEPVVPRQLPAATRFFAGREAELKELDELLDGVGGDGQVVMISAVTGMAGVGKTALAVQWARKVAGRFPDGQLYVNLRGYDADGATVTPEEVAGWFLAALGVPTARIPADAQARVGLYRSELAGRRVLIVLDNARDAVQVRPLLPGEGRCLVVVTSRSALAGLAAAEGAQPLRLGPLSAEEAVRLLAARLDPERVAAEPGAVTELAGWSGQLPLALAVIAARAAADPRLPLSMLAAQLAGAEAAGGSAAGTDLGRLEVLETGDPATSLRQLLSWSYRQLSPAAAAMFALLGVHCGPDITVPAAASLAAVPRTEARQALVELADASLATEHRPGRYVMHDLVRVYAAGQARQALGPAGIRPAIGRSLDHYLHTVVTSSDVPSPFTVAPPAPGVLPERLAGAAALLDWARAEHQVLLQAIAQATAAGLLTHAWQLFHAEAWLVGGQGHWTDIRAAGQGVLNAAEAADDQIALGWTHLVIGWYGTFLGAGGEDLARALDHFRQAGDLSGQAWAHVDVGVACGAIGEWAEAITHSDQALALFRQTADQAGRGWALAGLGQWHARLGNYELARGYARQAQQASPVTGDPTALAIAWDALGVVHSGLGESRQAIGCYRQALALVHQLKYPMTRALMIIVLTELGDACQATGDLPAAAEAWQQAQQVLNDLGWPDLAGVGARLEQAGSPSPPS